jgi:hypothetical protein
VETAIRATLASGVGMLKSAKMHGVGCGTVQRIQPGAAGVSDGSDPIRTIPIKWKATSARYGWRGRIELRRRGHPGPQTKGRLVMLNLVMLALFAAAIALPGLIAVVMTRAIDTH